MKRFESVDDILEFAIRNEEEAYAFYLNLANSMENRQMCLVFEEFARQEQSHKEKLIAVKEQKTLVPAQEHVTDLKLSDYLVEVEPEPGMDYPKALVLAMNREKKAFKLYMDLAEISPKPIKDLFLFLAQEEAKHKLRIEIEYDDHVVTDN